MKIAVVLLALLVAGCNGTKGDRYVEAVTNKIQASEICYKGVKYVWFYPGSTVGWGTVRLDAETGNVIKCENSANKEY